MRAVKTFFSISFLQFLLICSLCGCNYENEIAQFSRVDITSLENIPEYGDTLSTFPGVKLFIPSDMGFSSGASVDSVYQYLVDVHLFLLAKALDGTVKFVKTEDTTLITPEGVYVGMPIGKASELAGSKMLYEPGWAYVVQLPSGWNAGIMVGGKMRESLIADLGIRFLFRR